MIDIIHSQFVRFLLVGVINTIFGYAVFIGMLLFGFIPSTALLMSTVMGVFFNFKTIGHWVFSGAFGNRILFFVLQYAFIYVLNSTLLLELINYGVKAAIAQLMLLLPMAILSFVINKFLIFRIST